MDDLIEQLTTLDLDDEEAEVYLRLLQRGPSKVSDLAPLVDIGRSKLYRLLDALGQRGIVTKGLERPTIYQAEPPDEVFQSSLRNLERRQSAVQEARSTVMEALDDLRNQPAEPAVYEWQVLDDRTEILSAMCSLAGEAREQIVLVSNQDLPLGPDPRNEEFSQVLVDQARASTRVRLLVDAPDAIANRLNGNPAPARLEMCTLTTSTPLAFLLADGRTLLAMVRWRSSDLADGGDVALRTDTPAMRQAYSLLFDKLWADADPVRLP